MFLRLTFLKLMFLSLRNIEGGQRDSFGRELVLL